MSIRAPSRLFRFGLFEADLENGRLTRKGIRIRLQEQPFRVLTMLLERSGQIVTREDLRQQLWPAGTYVDFEGSLYAALKRLRAALDDNADNPRFIETVPKRGYRFIAPVTVEVLGETAEANPTPLPASVPSPSAAAESAANRRGSRFIFPRRRRAAVVSAAAAVTALVAFLILHKRALPLAVAGTGKTVASGSLRRSVAVLGFQNASGRAGDAWLSTALSEMLRTELGAGGTLRVVSGESVAQFRTGAPWLATDSLNQQTAAHLGTALNSGLLVLGSFAVLGDTHNARLRVDFRVQDAQTGTIIYEGAESGSESQFFGLAAAIGADLRQRLGLPVITATEEAGVVSSLPSDPDATRLYALGLGKLRNADVAAAKDLFLEAETIAPRFPLVHLMLYRAWAGLGYDQKAQKEIKIAYQLSSGLPVSERLRIEGTYDQATRNLDQAISAYRALYALYPESVDDAELLIDALYRAQRPRPALAIVNQLRKLTAPASEDPRLDYWQGELLAGTGNSMGEPYFEKAAAEAASRGQTLLYARFRLYQCRDLVYSDHPQGATPYCKEAYDIFMAAGNHLDAADALRTIGDRSGSKGDMSGARALYQQALAILRPMGEHEKTGVVLNNMAITYENQGQMAQAEKLFRQAAETWTACGDSLHAGVALGNIGDVLMVRGQLRSAESQYGRARRQIEVSDPGGIAYLLYSIANIRLFEGDIAGAQRYSGQAMEIARRGKDANNIAVDNEVIGAIRVASGDLAGARQSFQQALAIRTQQADRGDIAEIETELAGVSLEEGKVPEAEQALGKPLAEFRSENAILDEIKAETVLSRVLLREGKLASARQAASSAVALSATSGDLNLKLSAAILGARVHAAELCANAKAKSKPDFTAPRQELLHVMTIARRLGYFGIECDSRLALAKMELRENPASAHAHLTELAREAHLHGMNLVARKATTLAASATEPSSHLVF